MANTSQNAISSNGGLSVQLGQHQSFGQTSQAVSQQSMSMTNTMPSTIQSTLSSATAVNQMFPPHNQTMTTTSASNITMPQPVQGTTMNTAQQNQPQANQSMAAKDRCTIWQGIIEYHEKSMPANPLQTQRVSHSLPCTVSSILTNGDSYVNAYKWPNRLMLQLIPRQLIVISNLFITLKTASRHVLIHFPQESEALSKLCKIMSSGLVGCIQFPLNCDIRIMVVLYMPEKKIYMGFIANDQDSFFHNIRQMYEKHRKQQQKQRMQQLLGTNILQADAMGMQSSTASTQNIMMPQATSGNMPAANNNQINPRMPINQPQVASNNQAPPQVQAFNATIVHSTNMDQQQGTLNQAARLSQLEAARQQNLLKIQQLQQTLEAAQQKELQFKAAQEQQAQQHQQHILARQIAIRQQQLQHQQQQLDQTRQVFAQELQQQTLQQNLQMHQVNPTNNPQLQSLLQQKEKSDKGDMDHDDDYEVFSDEGEDSWSILEQEMMEEDVDREIKVEEIEAETTVSEEGSSTSEQFTQTPSFLDSELSHRSLSSDLGKLFLSDDSKPDITIQCGECTIPAHRNILAARSEVLKTKMAEFDTGILQIVDMEASVCRKFIEYLYTASLTDLSVELALGLHEAGKKYGVDSLQRQCSDFLKMILTTGNVPRDIDDILNSSQWDCFCKCQPELAVQVYQRAYKKAKYA